MPYLALARKWRPRTFSDMVGQEPILQMLTHAMEQQRVHHALLLTGTRGVGKTTLGRILAKCLNCAIGITATPCGNCHACQAIDGGQFLDLYEIDAASRTKVEDMREILDNIPYPPTQGRYKVYLIDEVHMLSKSSFNALLKTLEEPPEYVKFILATTEPKKLPITILSRCLQMHLKRIPAEKIAARLTHICATEQITADTAALTMLAQAADGSMRDALSLLDQAIAYGELNAKNTQVMLGSLTRDDILPLVTALAAHDGTKLFQALTTLAECAPDFEQVLASLIDFFHQLAIAQIIPGAINDATVTPYLAQFTPEEVQLYYQIALLGRRDLAYSPNPQQGLEMSMLRMLAFNPESNTTTATAAVREAPILAPIAIPPATVVLAPSNALATTLPTWKELLPKLELSGMAYALAANCTLTTLNDQQVVLTVNENHQPMINAKSKERITEALCRVLNKPIQLTLSTTTAPLNNTPHKESQNEREQQLATAKKAILNRPHIQELIARYDATVDVSLT